MSDHKPDPIKVNGALRAIVAVMALLAIVAAALVFAFAGPGFSVTSVTGQPYGGCKEGWQAPRSQGAADCRDLGWFVHRRVVVNPDGVVVTNRFKACQYEDSTFCYWDAARVGDRHGQSFVNLSRQHQHPVLLLVDRFRR